jgi:Kef-type K+ transport system membrane component KefB
MSGLSWHNLSVNPLVAFGLLLTLGVIGGQIATRITRLPGVTGYILTGLIIGPAGLGLIQQSVLDEASLFVQLGFGLALFEIGRRLDFSWLARERALLGTCLLGALITFAALYMLLVNHDFSSINAAPLAAIGMAAAPPVVLDIVRQSRAEGQVSERLETATGLNTLLALAAFALALTFHNLSEQSAANKLIATAWSVLGAVILGLVIGQIAVRLNHWLSSERRETQRVLLFAMIALVVGLSELLHILPSLALLILGISLRNPEQDFVVAESDLLSKNTFLLVAFFVALGAGLAPANLTKYWPLALSFIGLRLLLGLLVWMGAARLNGLNLKQGALVGAGLTPLSSSAFALAAISGPTLVPAESIGLILAVLCILDTVGPVLTHFALRLSGETRALRP